VSNLCNNWFISNTIPDELLRNWSCLQHFIRYVDLYLLWHYYYSQFSSYNFLYVFSSLKVSATACCYMLWYLWIRLSFLCESCFTTFLPVCYNTHCVIYCLGMIRMMGKAWNFSVPYIALVYSEVVCATSNSGILSLVFGICELKIILNYLCC